MIFDHVIIFAEAYEFIGLYEQFMVCIMDVHMLQYLFIAKIDYFFSVRI